MNKRFFRRMTALLLALVLSAALYVPAAAAEGEDGDDTPVVPGAVTDITLNILNEPLDGPVELVVGDVYRDVNATVYPEDANNQNIFWESNDPKVASVVERSGTIAVITAKGPGTCIITATSTENHEISASVTVTVKAKPSVTPGGPDDPSGSEALYITETAVTLDRGTTHQLGLNGTMLDGGPGSYTVLWESSNTDVARVSTDGLVAALGMGEATISATVKGTGDDAEHRTVTCKVTVTSNATIDIYPGLLRFDRGTRPQTLTVGTAEPNLTIKWTSDDESIATVVPSEDTMQAIVTNAAPGETKIRALASNLASDDCTVTVSGVRLISGNDTSANPAPLARGTVRIGKTLTLNYRTYGAAQGAGTAIWESSDNSVAYVTAGRVVGRSIGTARITVTIGDYTSAVCEVTVTEIVEGVTRTNGRAGVPLAFADLASDLYRECSNATEGGYLSYITNLNVNPDQGVLYYNYAEESDTGAGVSAGEQYYYNPNNTRVRSIGDLTFIPNKDFNGVATISYIGWTTQREMYNGTIQVTVDNSNDIVYTTSEVTPVTFRASDFNDICRSRTGRDLSYVTFELPLASRGTLYYSYTFGGQNSYAEAVSATTQYYRTRTPSLDLVTFLPAADFGGTVRIAYRGVDTAGIAFTGGVTVIVTGDSKVINGNVYYSAEKGDPVHFQASDFNTACREATGEPLDYVRFNVTGTGQGTLYYNYRTNNSYGSWVNTYTNYYVSPTGTNLALGNITFVPAYSASKQVVISYTGYGKNGTSYVGLVYIDVKEKTAQSTIRYSAYSGKAVSMQASDFNSVSIATTGYSLNYVRFQQLPATSVGSLVYQYNNNRDTYTSQVSIYNNYYYNTGYNQLSNVSFLPGRSYTGTVRIGYTGYNRNGGSFTGTVEITVVTPAPSTLNYNGTRSRPVQITSSNLRGVCSPMVNQELSYIEFTSLPAAASGRLYSSYSGLGTGTPVTTGTRYTFTTTAANGTTTAGTLDQICFVPRGRVQGTATAAYTAVTTSGEKVNGYINFNITAGARSSHFNDMGNFAWAVDAVDCLYENHVIIGTGGSQFSPALNIRRCDFVVMLCRNFGFTSASTTSFPDVAADSYYAHEMAAALAVGIVSPGGNFYPESALTRQDAMVMLYNALVAAGRSVPNGALVSLNGYVDSGEIAAYARNAVASLVQLGVVTGTDDNRLNPWSYITRAEIAVLMHDTMTM